MSPESLILVAYCLIEPWSLPFLLPGFFTRSPGQAKGFFTPGRVFMMLWSSENLPNEILNVIEEENTVPDNRRWLVAAEGVYTGPFEGPATVRRFVVVQAGARSTLCL